MTDVGVAHDDKCASRSVAGRGVRGELQQREDRIVVDRVVAQSTMRGLRAHQPVDVVGGGHSPRLALLASLRHSDR